MVADSFLGENNNALATGTVILYLSPVPKLPDPVKSFTALAISLTVLDVLSTLSPANSAFLSKSSKTSALNLFKNPV